MMNKIITSFTKVSIVQIILSLLLIYLYILGVKSFLPNGINKAFLSRLKEGVLYFTAVSLFLLTISSFLFYVFSKYHLKGLEKNKLSDFFLILLPLTPIVQYLLLNQDILSSFGTFYILLLSFAASTIAIISIPVILSFAISRTWTLSLNLSLIFLFFYMPILALDNSWHEVGSFRIQLPIFVLITVGSFLLYRFNDFYLKLIVVIFFISNSTFAITALLDKKVNNPTHISKITNALKETHLKIKPDIYLLTYDAYVNNQTMLQYGIDNRKQESYLNSKGFKIYPNTYSIGSSTWSTMLRLLNMSSIYPGRSSQVIAGKSNIHNFLRAEGYLLGGVMLHESFWEKKTPSLDYFYPKLLDNGHIIISQAILKGKFDFDAPALFAKRDKKEFIKMKRHFMSLNKHPKFLYTHTGPSHSQNSGKCRPNEIALFEQRLKKANEEMKEDIETILKNNPNALIIVNGDHGPYLTGNCERLQKNGFMQIDQVSRLDLQDRFGTFLAIKWPSNIKSLDRNITVIQDIFPAIIEALSFKQEKIKRIKPSTTDNPSAGAKIHNGIIIGGINDGERLFIEK